MNKMKLILHIYDNLSVCITNVWHIYNSDVYLEKRDHQSMSQLTFCDETVFGLSAKWIHTEIVKSRQTNHEVKSQINYKRDNTAA